MSCHSRYLAFRSSWKVLHQWFLGMLVFHQVVSISWLFLSAGDQKDAKCIQLASFMYLQQFNSERGHACALLQTTSLAIPSCQLIFYNLPQVSLMENIQFLTYCRQEVFNILSLVWHKATRRENWWALKSLCKEQFSLLTIT